MTSLRKAAEGWSGPAAYAALVIGYAVLYAPFGFEGTDGGFLTGLAWQLECGKTLYRDAWYVRPPLSVWLRQWELRLLPESLSILGERWIFYGKVGLYTLAAAAVLCKGARMWQVAAVGFIVSVHGYAPTAWHTIDGLFFASFAIWALFRNGAGWSVASGVLTACSLLCKQSFYPLFPIFLGYILYVNRSKLLPYLSGFFVVITLFLNKLYQENALIEFFDSVSGSTGPGLALRHGILDYFHISLPLISGALGLGATGYFFRKSERIQKLVQGCFIGGLMLSFIWSCLLRGEYTVPFSQVRLLFWVASGYVVFRFWKEGISRNCTAWPQLLLLATAWSSALSWGLNVPVLFATPLVFPLFEISRALRVRSTGWFLVLVSGLLLTMRIAYEFVYRDGRRSEMTVPLGEISPKLQGIYSTGVTAEKLAASRDLYRRYGPRCFTAPAFTQADFLWGIKPVLPLNWIVRRETPKGLNPWTSVEALSPPVYCFVDKSRLSKTDSDPELEFTRSILREWEKVEENDYFITLTRRRE